jgi:tripartite-type tricarboxylate transporter receptor subunit TctC
MSVKGVCQVIVAIATLVAFPALPQQYPSKPIRVLMLIAAGSPSDVALRAAGAQLTTSLGQPLNIENRPGGNLLIGAEACAKAAADGYNFCVTAKAAISTNPHVYLKLPYDPEKDFRPVTGLWNLIHGMMVSGKLPVNSVKELKAMADVNSSALNFGTMGDAAGNLHWLWLNEQWNAKIENINYKGANLIMNALISGELQLTTMTMGGMEGQLKAGKIKLLAVGSQKRLRLLPDVPTYGEVGLTGFPRTWWGLFAPAATPDPIIRRINSEFVRLFHSPKFEEYLENVFLENIVSSPEEFAAFLKKDREEAGLMIKRFNIPRQ